MPSRSSLHIITPLTLLLAVFVGGCGNDTGSTGTDPVDIPTMPHPMPGQASLGGHVLDGKGMGVQGATITITETDAVATSDATGAYQIMVPSDSTVTLTATAAGMANTFRESVVLASASTVADFDVLLLATAEMAAVNMLGQQGLTAMQSAMRGAVAVRLHTTSATCMAAGAHISVFPTAAAKVLYSAAASTAGALDMPDAMLQDVQPGATIAAWLATAVPPGNMLRIDVQKAGCQLMAQSPSLGGLMYPGLRSVTPGALTEADLFLQ